MHINSTEFLRFIAKNNCYILFEKAVPAGRLKRELICLATRDGRTLSLSTPSGFVSCPVELPREMFDDFVAASLIEEESPQDSDGRIVYRLTKTVTRAPLLNFCSLQSPDASRFSRRWRLISFATGSND